MKKLISLALSLLLLISSVTISNAAVTKTSDIAEEGALFADFVGSEFNSNYFFVASFDTEEYFKNTSAIDASVYLNITTTSKTPLNLKVVKISVDSKTVELISDYEISAETSVVKEFLSAFQGSESVFTDNPAHARIGVALMNPEDLTSDAEIKLSLSGYYITANGYSETDENKVVYGEVTHEFYAPVTFDDEALSSFGELLTKLKFGNDIDADDVVEALDGAARSTNLENTIFTLKKALTAEYVNVAELANTLQKGNLTINKTAICDGLTVEMPYIALADGVGTEEKVYAPSVENIVRSAKDGKATMSLDLDINVNDAPLAHKPIIAQKVRVQLPAEFDKSKGITVKHGDETLSANVVNDYAEFITDSFSSFTIEGSAVTYDENTSVHTTKAELKITQDDPDSNVFTLSLTPDDGQIIKYATSGFKVAVSEYNANSTDEPAMKNFTYEIIPANGITITNVTKLTPESTELQAFNFVASATDRENLITVGEKEALPIAKLIIKGTGDLEILTSGLQNENAEISKKFYMESFTDNDSVKADVRDSSGFFTIKEKKFDIRFNVNFNLNLQEEDTEKYTNNAEYIDIAIELKNELTGDVHTVKIGKGTNADDVTYLPVTYNAETSSASGVVTLPANAKYAYKISGLGFRTFRGSVYLDDDKEITLWNNALTAPQNVVKGDNTTANSVTFIVGDVYEDGIVDIYDISAVTSYFGAKDIDRTNENVYACDLDRDGQISVQDLAWAMYSFGN